jgi:hypothetical protein
MNTLLPLLALLVALPLLAAPTQKEVKQDPKSTRPTQGTSTFRRTPDGAVRGSDGETLRRTPDGAVRSSAGLTARRTPDGAVRFSDGQTVRTTPDGALRTSDGIVLRRTPDGSWRGSDGTLIRTRADGTVTVSPPPGGSQIDPARAVMLTQPSLGVDPRKIPNDPTGGERKPGG